MTGSNSETPRSSRSGGAAARQAVTVIMGVVGRKLRIGTARSRLLVAIIRADSQQRAGSAEMATQIGMATEMIGTSDAARVAR